MSDTEPVTFDERAELGQALVDIENGAHRLLREYGYWKLRANRAALLDAAAVVRRAEQQAREL